MQAIAVGPFAFSVPSLLVFGSIALGYAAGVMLERPRRADTERALLTTLAVALVAARISHVIEWFGTYRQHPLDIVDLRDGGWNIPLGLLVAALYVMAAGRRHATRRRAGNPRPVFVAIGVAMLAYVAGSATVRLFGPPVGIDVTSAISLSTLEGRTVGLARFGGRPTVLNLWATWCAPCRRELPLLVAAQDAHPEINFVFANQGEDAAAVTRYLAVSGVAPRNVLLDARSDLARVGDAQGWPTTLYLDAHGRLIASDTGELTATRLAKRLAEMASGGPNDSR